jgi:alpha-L-fucosidase
MPTSRTRLSPAIAAIVIVLLNAAMAGAQTSVRGPLTPEDVPVHSFQSFTPERWDASSFAPPGAAQWWTDARLGMFIHFGLSSLRGTELGWSRYTRLPPDGGHGSIPDDVYDNLYKQFTLQHFNAKEWVRIAQDAGAKYIVVVTKHHDGFHMWDTAFSDHKITNSPFGRDYVKEIADACHAAGMPLGFYFSQRDWYHPDYNPTGTNPGRDEKKYIEYEFNAVHELLTKYGKVDVLWFDAAYWSGMFTEDNWDSERLYRMARQCQPNILINNRASIPGDFDTPEQHIGSFQNNRPWESCITLCGGWAYNPRSAVKTLKQVVSLMVLANGGDGNLLLNVGPRGDGTIQPSEVERLHQVGDWMRKYGDTLHATRGGPYRGGAWGGSTHKGNTVWIHVLNWTGSTIVFDPLPYRITDAKLLTGGTVDCRNTAESLTIKVAKANQDPLDTIVQLTLDRDVPDTQVVGAARTTFVVDPQYGSLLSAGATLSLSSAAATDRADDHAKLFTGGLPGGGVAFTTGTEAVPSATIDLGTVHTVKGVLIVGRDAKAGGWKLALEISADGQSWKPVWTSPEVRPQWFVEVSEVRAGADTVGVAGRYLRLTQPGTRPAALGLQRVDVYGQ